MSAGSGALAVLRAPVAARTWREVGYVFAGVLFAVPAFVLPVVGLVALATSVLTLGLPLLAAVLVAARFAVWWFRLPARALLGWDWRPPRPLPGGTWVARGRAALTNGRAWRALAYCFLKLPFAALTGYVTALLLVGVPYLLTAPLWWPAGRSVYLPLDALALLFAFPWVVRGLVFVDRVLTYTLLAPGPAEQRIARLESSRAALTADAATTLRRVERDLHDGTQARLVAVGMTLSRIEARLDKLGGATGDIAELVGAARGNVTDALAELREIVRGIHPPALDEGLPTALTTLASRSGLPVGVSVTLPERPTDAAATALYFAAAELLTNAARHAGAGRVELTLSADRDWLRLVVTDDGRGGAAPAGGTGLAGLARRAEALDGRFTVVSPPGGPTTVTMLLPRG